MSKINESIARYCYIDFDIDSYRQKLGTAAAFVNATNSRYGFSSQDIRRLGGSELSRILDLIQADHEWSSKASAVKIRPPPHGNRIVVRLSWDVAPLACENFATLCANGTVLPGTLDEKPKPIPIGDCGKPLTYRGSNVHRIVPGFVVQGGDIVKGNGSGGESVYSKKFKDERPGLALKHDRRGVLSMGNSGKNSNTSQFFFTFAAAPACDGKHVVFGEVVSGWEVLEALEGVGSSKGDPLVPVTVADCGVWEHLHTPGAGYWFDKPDAEAFSGISPVFVVRPRVAVAAPNGAALEKFEKALGSCCLMTLIDISKEESESMASLKLQTLLDRCSIDVVILAPACQSLIGKLQVPTEWEGVSLESVAFVAKPIDAVSVVSKHGWIHQKCTWTVDCGVQ